MKVGTRHPTHLDYISESPRCPLHRPPRLARVRRANRGRDTVGRSERIGTVAFTVRPPSATVVPVPTMMVEPTYKGYRIEVYAEPVDGYWDAVVRIRRVLTDDKVHVEHVTCRKLSAELAETRAAIWAWRWIDLNGFTKVLAT